MRPCPWAGCRYNLRIDITRTGNVRVDSRAKMPDTCALDVADRGEHSLAELGLIMGLTHEAVRKVELRAVQKLLNAGVKRSWIDGIES